MVFLNYNTKYDPITSIASSILIYLTIYIIINHFILYYYNKAYIFIAQLTAVWLIL